MLLWPFRLNRVLVGGRSGPYRQLPPAAHVTASDMNNKKEGYGVTFVSVTVTCTVYSVLLLVFASSCQVLPLLPTPGRKCAFEYVHLHVLLCWPVQSRVLRLKS